VPRTEGRCHDALAADIKRKMKSPKSWTRFTEEDSIDPRKRRKTRKMRRLHDLVQCQSRIVAVI